MKIKYWAGSRKDNCRGHFGRRKSKIVEGTGSMSFTCYEKNHQTYYLDGKDNTQTKDHLLGILLKGNNKFFLDTFHIKNLSNREKPLDISYKFKLSDYYKEIDNEIYINLNLNKAYNNLNYDVVKRKIPVEWNNTHVYKTVSVFNIPKEYTVSYLPKNASAFFDKFSYNITYRIEGSNVIQTKEIVKDFLLLEVSEFSKWNQVSESLSKAYRDVLILKKI